jgi:hypothetical protein
MEDSISPEHSIMLCMAALYISLTESIAEVFGRDIEPRVNHLLNGMKPHLPDDAGDMVDFLLGFGSDRLPSNVGNVVMPTGVYGQITRH